MYQYSESEVHSFKKLSGDIPPLCLTLAVCHTLVEQVASGTSLPVPGLVRCGLARVPYPVRTSFLQL